MRASTKIVIVTGAVAAACGGGVFGLSYVKLQRPMDDVIGKDPRNAGMAVRTRYEGYVPGGTLVYDFQQPGPSSSAVDVFRVFLQYADAMKAESFDSVELAFRGETKFVLDGASFRTLGASYDTENPVFTMRTFPEKLRKPNGRPAFERWEGGMIGVLSAQMEDFNAFNRQWYGAPL